MKKFKLNFVLEIQYRNYLNNVPGHYFFKFVKTGTLFKAGTLFKVGHHFHMIFKFSIENES